MKSHSDSRLLGLTLLLVAGIACGDSTSSDNGGNGTGAGNNNGGNGTGAGMNTGGDDGGGANTGGTPTTGGAPEGGGNIGNCPMAVSNVPEGPEMCNLYLQDCPSLTDTCEIEDSDPATPGFQAQTFCITRNGLKSAGEACNMPDDCGPHLTCFGNICSPFCCPDDPDSCLGGDCSITVTLQDENMMPSGFTFQGCSYAASCDLFTPDSCEPDENCYLDSPGAAACFAPNGRELADGAACTFLNECLDSSICIGDDQAGYFCHFHCIINSNEPPGLGGCPAGQLCDINSFDTGFADVGFCHL